MGQSFINCSVGNVIFSDYWDNGFCANCGGWMCGDCHYESVDKYVEVEEGSEDHEYYGDSSKTCDICEGVKIDRNAFIYYVIKKTGKSREQLEEEFLAFRRGEK